MLGWKGEWGYFTNNDISLSSMVKLSSVPFVISNYDSDPKAIKGTFYNSNDFYNHIKSIVGQLADAFYCAPFNGFKMGDSYRMLNSVFPSITLSGILDGYPHTNSHLYYFKSTSLNKILIWSSSNKYFGIYTLSLDRLYYSEIGGVVPVIYGGANNDSCIAYFLNVVDPLNTRTNAFRFYIQGDFKYKRFFSDYAEISVSLMNSLFSTASEPDFGIPDNPYEPGGDSSEGGGGGTFDGESDLIPDSPLPIISSADTGFTRIYSPTLSQVQNLARYLWTDESIVETLWNVIKRYFEDPMQAFISFSLVPVPVPISGTEEFKVLFIPTGVNLNTVANQFVDVDCGTFELKEYYGSALDYSPNTKVSCYLPYIGTVSLNTDDVMGRTLQVKYRVDICSGSCVAKILVDGNAIYQFPGCCSIPIPFSSSDFSSYGSAIISAVKTGVAVATAGAGMPALGAGLVGMDASQQTGKISTRTTTNTERNPATGRQITTGTQKVVTETSGTEASLSGIAQTGISNTANAVTASKTIVERSGSFSGNSGFLGVRRPYLIIERPRMCMPANYQTLNGFPSMITMELSSCTGFTRVQQVQLTGIPATNPEQAEILQLLKGGVIF